MNDTKIFKNMMGLTRLVVFVLASATCFSCSQKADQWSIDTNEEWSPINTSTPSWDSPLAVHAVSPGPWVEKVEVRVGADTDTDDEIDVWTDRQEVKESYDYAEGFAKQIKRTPASMDLNDLPEGYGFGFE